MATETKIKGKLKAQGAVELQQQTANRVPVLNSNKEVVSSAVTDTELGYLTGATDNLQMQITDAQTDATNALSDASTAQNTINNHINDSVDAHDASAISNVPSGNLAATDVQAALNELQSDVDSRALDSAVIKKDGSVAFTADQSMGGFKLTGLAAPSSSSDAATKGYVDSALEGLRPKEAVRVATTAPITIATDLNAGDVIDGITLVAGDRVLVKDQASAAQNGIYIAGASPARSSDFDSLSPIDEINKAYVAVQQGTVNAGKLFVQYGAVAVLNTDPINFTFFNSVSGLVGGDGITVSGSNISVDHDGQGLQFVADQLALELDGSTLSKSASGLKLSDTAVTPGSYGSASETVSITVDQQGRLTSASEQAISITASQVSDFNEAAQDAVGAALTDTASVDLVYNDGANTISATVLPSGVDHDALQNFVANEHIDHSAVQIQTSANSGLSGGGDITATRSLVVDINGTTAETVADNADEILIWDSSANARRKMTRANFISGSGPSNTDGLPEGTTNLYFTEERAQDAVGSILSDSSSIDFTYNDGANTITAAVLPAGVDHDALNNFVANEHVDHSSVQIATAANTSGLSGGGNITATRNLSVDITGTTSLGANVDSADELIIYDVSASALKKATRSQLLGGAATSAGDLAEQSFSLANNQASLANITGFAFNNAVVRSFEALVSVQIDATADLFEAFKITGIQKGSDWDISIIATGDDSLVALSITSAGQMQYTSSNYAGFSAGTLKFRAITTSI